MDVGPCQDQGRQVKEVRRQLFLVRRVWSHDGRLPKGGSWKTASSQVLAMARNRRAKAKVAKAIRERRPLTSGQTVRKFGRLMRKPPRRLWCCQPTREVQSTRLASLGKNPETGTKVSGNLTRAENLMPMLSTLSWERESI